MPWHKIGTLIDSDCGIARRVSGFLWTPELLAVPSWQDRASGKTLLEEHTTVRVIFFWTEPLK